MPYNINGNFIVIECGGCSELIYKTVQIISIFNVLISYKIQFRAASSDSKQRRTREFLGEVEVYILLEGSEKLKYKNFLIRYALI